MSQIWPSSSLAYIFERGRAVSMSVHEATNLNGKKEELSKFNRCCLVEAYGITQLISDGRLTEEDYATDMGELNDFTNKLESILSRHRSTISFVDQLKSIELENHSAFTLAIVGQMKSGKSTLINSLVGEDLAAVGIDETTATVNWFRFGSREQSRKFQVTWNYTPATTETFPVAETTKWIGNSEAAKRTRYIEFFCEADLLKRVQIVDTPGSRSVLESHQETLENFLLAAKRCEDQTNFYGGSADCLAYVLPNVTKESDVNVLSEFAVSTRFPGSTPYNSLGLIVKWEATNDRPWEMAAKRAERTKQQLRRFLSDVLVVSGPLYRVTRCVDLEDWNRLVQFVQSVDETSLTNLLLDPSLYAKPKDHIAWSPEARLNLQSQFIMFEGKKLPWPCFKLILQYARHFGFESGKALRTAIAKLSGVDLLLDTLETKFFSRSNTIRAFTQLRKVLIPCEQAIKALKNQKLDAVDRIEDADLALAELANFGDRVSQSRQFVQASLADVRSEPDKLERTIRDLEIASKNVREPYLRFDQDMQAIQLLDEHPGLFDSAQQLEILTVLGAYGTSDADRFDQYADWHDQPGVIERRLGYWIGCGEMSVGARQRILDQVISRLEEAATKFHNIL